MPHVHVCSCSLHSSVLSRPCGAPHAHTPARYSTVTTCSLTDSRSPPASSHHTDGHPQHGGERADPCQGTRRNGLSLPLLKALPSALFLNKPAGTRRNQGHPSFHQNKYRFLDPPKNSGCFQISVLSLEYKNIQKYSIPTGVSADLFLLFISLLNLGNTGYPQPLDVCRGHMFLNALGTDTSKELGSSRVSNPPLTYHNQEVKFSKLLIHLRQR